jgi:Rieske 2Fe-2S family protein
MADVSRDSSPTGSSTRAASVAQWTSGVPRPAPGELQRELATIRVPLEEATTLPARFYLDPGIHQAEVETIFTRMWLCVGREEDVERPGDFLVRDVGNDSVLVVRDDRGVLRAFHNVCRHRGSRLVTEPAGRGLKNLLCPYHAWTYELDGSLRHAPHMEEARQFEAKRFGLNPVRIGAWDGFVFICLSATEPSLEEFLGAMTTRFAAYGMAGLKRGRRITYTVDSNWKMLAENYSECYHCALIHPELNKVSHYLSGGSVDLVNDAAVGGWMELRRDDYQTMSISGHTARPPFPGISDEDHRRIHYYIVYPNLLLSLHPDYVMTHTVWPQGPGRSEIVNEFLFAADEVAKPGFDPSDAVDFWDLTNRQDWRACELAQKGVQSAGYDRGRLSALEWMMHIFDNFVADRLTGVKQTVPERLTGQAG